MSEDKPLRRSEVWRNEFRELLSVTLGERDAAREERDAARRELDRLRDWIFAVHGYAASCDWGHCDGETVGLRGSPDIGGITDWLCVCQKHYDEAPPDERLLLSSAPAGRSGAAGDDEGETP